MGLKGKQHLGMAYRKAPLFEKGLSVRLQIQKPHGVCNRGAAFANALRNLVLGEAEIVVEPFVGASFFDGVEVLALEVFNQGEFEHFSVACLAHDCRGFGEPKFSSGAPSALAGDKFVLVTDLSD